MFNLGYGELLVIGIVLAMIVGPGRIANAYGRVDRGARRRFMRLTPRQGVLLAALAASVVAALLIAALRGNTW